MSAFNREHQHFFVHTPKAAGSSMLAERFVGGQGHMTARVFRDKHPEEWEAYPTWGFVRNPFDRAFAIYNAACQHAPKWPRVERLSWPEYVPTLRNRWGLVKPHTLPMTRFLCAEDDGSDLLVDFVGRFEHLRRDWRSVCKLIGVRPTRLRHRNATEHVPWREAYTPELAEIVAEVYAADFDTFGYDPGDFAP